VKALEKTRHSEANRDPIIRYLEAGGEGNEEGLILTDKQRVLLDRWNFAAEKIREQKYRREQIANFIIGVYKISRDTAYRDIVNAEHVFACSYPINKKFLIQLRIEILQKRINDAYIDGDRFNAVKMEKELREYIKMYPETALAQSPKTIVFNLQQNVFQTKEDITHEEAFQEADAILKQLEDFDDF
jgi:hypothetical protein